MTPLLASPPLKVCSSPEHNSWQQIDTQNTGILARRMDSEQGREVGNGFLSHPVKHLQVAFKTGGQIEREVTAGKVADCNIKQPWTESHSFSSTYMLFWDESCYEKSVLC